MYQVSSRVIKYYQILHYKQKLTHTKKMQKKQISASDQQPKDKDNE